MNLSPPSDVPIEIDVQSVKALLDSQQDLLLLDCREDKEYAHARIDGAVQIPMGQIPERVGELEAHRERPVVVHCHHGGRSLRVTHWLRSQGFTNVRNMTGGIDAWSLQIDSALPRY
ncbi:MAG TPA: rhodanese-like domain-containing protein [Pirellulaceae bacterium]|nr:rhodanese-like domain-containing protein [Pirellulaceae bacterium]